MGSAARDRTRGATVGLAALLISLAAMVLAATPALASRTYESQLTTELATPLAAATDSANNAWIGDAAGGVYKFNSANERLVEHIPGSDFSCNGERVYSLAVDESDDDLYAATSCGDTVDRFSSTGTLLNTLGPFGNGNVFVAVDNTTGPNQGRVYAAETEGATVNSVDANGSDVNFTGSASYISGNQITGTPSARFGAPVGIAVAPSGNILVVDAKQGQFGEQGRNVIDEFEPSGIFVREIKGPPSEPFGDVTAVAVDPSTGNILAVDRGEHAGENEEPAVVDEFDQSGGFLAQITGAETPEGSLGYDSFDPGGISVSSSGYLYVPDVTHHLVDIFSPTFKLPKVTYNGVTNGTAAQTTATLNATVDPNGGGAITTCKFEFVEEAIYQPAAHDPFKLGHSAPCSPSPSGSESTSVSAEISGLTPETTYRYRLVASNGLGTPNVGVSTFSFQPPSVEGVSSSGLTAETAHLNAKVNPEGLDTHYQFEYGTTAAYGSSAPVPEAEIGSANVAHPVTVEIAGLTKGATYHFRLVATNALGTTLGEDQTFGFFPPPCPNEHIRQQTGAQYLPDCRAYELVSPENAGGTALFPEGPNSSVATNPSRFAFGGLLGTVPGAGDAINNLGDLYVATRTSTGWITHYVGIHGNQTNEAGRPPAQSGFILSAPGGELTDLSMNEFIDWNDGDGGGFSGPEGPEDVGSYAPYFWDASGNELGRLPTNVGLVQEGEDLYGATQASPDFTHYFFSSAALTHYDQFSGGSTPGPKFTPEALTAAPGSAYDNNLKTGTVTLISKTESGTNIPQDAGDLGDQYDFISFPGVSTDGSHILMSTKNSGTCVVSECSDPNTEPVERQLYMRVNDAVTYDVSQGHNVEFVGMTSDGSKVYFTSEEQLTPSDTDSSIDLYMWSEATNTITLISQGEHQIGNSDMCNAPWTTKCGIVPYETGRDANYEKFYNGLGGNGTSDNSVAEESGEVYFYSPQKLDGSRGVEGAQNLYVYRNGTDQFVATFAPGTFCYQGSSSCSAGPIVRMQVSPDGSHMAFLTADRITSYDNAGYLEMYTYDPSSEALICVSCLPDGAPPTTNVEASLNGRFMTNDGRAFFSTGDPLVPQDTDEVRDVYEYVDGRPQLISAGTGENDSGLSILGDEVLSTAGLVGVSENGTDAYFSTYDSLVGQDHNGNSLKFYDARVDGGFPYVPPAAPCAAADECHGPGSSPPTPTANGTGAYDGSGGNLPKTASSHHGKHRRHRRRKHRRGSRRSRSTRGIRQRRDQGAHR